MSALSEFNEFEPRLKLAKNRFQLITGINSIQFEVKPIIIEPWLQFFKFGLLDYHLDNFGLIQSEQNSLG